MSRILIVFISVWLIGTPLAVADESDSSASEALTPAQVEAAIESLDEALYSPFIERYVLDELKALRTEMLLHKNELQKQILDREHQSVDRAVTYATDTVTYFFYLVAAASSILVIVGWTSIRDIKERVHSFANSEISKLIDEYESRLESIEKQLRAKSIDIEDNKEEIETAKEIQSLWLRAQQENNTSGKIRIYDQILSINPSDTEALTYKADAVLELDEPQWAINLCTQALDIDSKNAHAYFQLGCAFTLQKEFEEAIKRLTIAVEMNASYRDEVFKDEMLKPLWKLKEFKELFG